MLNFAAIFIALALSALIPGSEFVYLFCISNLLTALSNLLPIKGHDGFLIIESLISLYSKRIDNKILILNFISFVFTTLLLFIAMYVLLKLGEGYWITLIFLTSFLNELSNFTQNSILRE